MGEPRRRNPVVSLAGRGRPRISMSFGLVEYWGMRIVCQSVVPGILHGEKSHSLLYGAVETLSELQCNDEMHKLLDASIGEGCMV